MVGLKDIAELCGTSVTTVSFVVNGRSGMRITEETRQRVLDMAYRLRYRTESIARPPRIGRPDAIGVVCNLDNTSPYMAQVLYGVTLEAARNDFVPKLFFGGDGDGVVILRRALEQNVAGLVIMNGSRSLQDELIRRCNRCNIRVVLVNCGERSGGCASFVTDDAAGGRQAAEALLAAGCRRLAYLDDTSCKCREYWLEARLGSFVETVRSQCPEAELMKLPSAELQNLDENSPIGRLLLAPRRRPDGIFCFADTLAFDIERFAILHGISVPGDISIVGYGDHPGAEYATVPVATISERLEELGAAAIAWLLDARQVDMTPHRLPVTLLRRASLKATRD